MEILKSWLGNYDLLFFIINLCMRCLVINPLVRLLVGCSEIIFSKGWKASWRTKTNLAFWSASEAYCLRVGDGWQEGIRSHLGLFSAARRSPPCRALLPPCWRSRWEG